MQVSAAGLALIEDSEGWSPGPYLDTVASPHIWTAYFGETKGIGPNSPHITRAQGEDRLRRRFASDYANSLLPFVTLDGFTQHMYDALASFIWNCGTGAVGVSTTVGKRLRARDWKGAADALLAWDKAGGRAVPGLTARRKRERELFLKAESAAEWLKSDELKWVREFDALKGKKDAKANGRRAELVLLMTSRRKSIWHAAQESGWTKLDRERRYNSLKARTAP